MALKAHILIQNDLPIVDDNGYCSCICDDGVEFSVDIKTLDFQNTISILCTVNNKDVEINIPPNLREILKAYTINIEEAGQLYPEATCSKDFTGTGPFQWTDAATKLFLTLYKEKKELVSERKLKTFKIMWKVISGEMSKHGYNISALQAENKMKTMDRSYKNMMVNNKKTGRGRATCKYEDELSEIIGKKHNMVPLAISSSSGLCLRTNIEKESTTPTTISLPLMIPDNPEPVDEDSTRTSTNTVDETPKPKPKSKKKSRNEEIIQVFLEEIQESRNSREEFQGKVFDEYKRFIDSTLEHRQTMKKLAEKKLEILEELKNIILEKNT